METIFNINKTSRNVILRFLENHTLEQLNTIPEGFSNNSIWNIAHCIVVQQQLVYNLSGLSMMVSDDMIVKYKRGTKPEHKATQEEVDEIKFLLFSTLEQIKKDFVANIFQDYSEFTTMSGFTIRNAKEALEFNNYHEAVHTGIMMQIRKFI
ncbi:DinB family protein [Flavobacterium sp.]|uniref:DinB family protein n=1 Tax=Flavobacterium sp. TaxID=239 RepID=UPI0025FA50C5|nr:DinB family protein [Flavobacterium sp.]